MKFLDYINQQYEVIKDRDPAIKTKREVLLYPYFWAQWKYRKAHRLYEAGKYYKARKISQRAARKTGIEIHPGAVIGEGLFIDHGHGVVIGETCVIGDNVTIYQGVTLGGTGKEKGKRHPSIGDNVMISAGAKILGSFMIGENSKIGAGSVVLHEVPPNSTVVGVPGRVVKRNNEKIPSATLNQVDLPDPITTDIDALKTENDMLRHALENICQAEEAEGKKNCHCQEIFETLEKMHKCQCEEDEQ